MTQKKYDTLSQAMNSLRDEGYTTEYDFKDDQLVETDGDRKLDISDFEIDHVLRFEGISNPDDNSVLFAISAENDKGQLVMPYGAYADNVSPKLLQKLEHHPNANPGSHQERSDN
ncbi:MAG: phosphoribosylpyrophosphate synthetase [Bacteroidota bacterium]